MKLLAISLLSLLAGILLAFLTVKTAEQIATVLVKQETISETMP